MIPFGLPCFFLVSRCHYIKGFVVFGLTSEGTAEVLVQESLESQSLLRPVDAGTISPTFVARGCKGNDAGLDPAEV